MALNTQVTFLQAASLAIGLTLLSVLACDAKAAIMVGDLDGKRKITTNDIQNGFHDRENNFLKPCARFDHHRDNYVLAVEMGSFTDYLIPSPDVTVCDILTGANTKGNYLYAPKDPRGPDWDGYIRPISPPPNDGALGGSAHGYAERYGRAMLSFWGDNSDDPARVGGCCALVPGDSATWGRPYRLLLIPSRPAMYFAWRLKPAVAVIRSPVAFEVSVCDRHGKPYKGNVTFRITTNGDSVIVKSSTGYHAHYAVPPTDNCREYVVTVELLSGPEVANTKTLETKLSVVGRLPMNVAPCPAVGIPHLLHFGEEGAAIRVPGRSVAIERDWFASTVAGGESGVRPEVGVRNVVRVDSKHSVQEVWKELVNDDGMFVARVPQRSVQFFAFYVYSAAAQQVGIRYGFDTAAVVYVGGERFTPHSDDPLGEGSFDVFLSEGFHQVFIKVFSEEQGGDNPRGPYTTSKFWIRVVGGAVGYTGRLTARVGIAAYELAGGLRITEYLHLEKERNGIIYSDFDGHLIDMQRISPKPGGKVGNLTWKILTTSDGKIPVDGMTLQQDKRMVVSYAAFSVHNSIGNQTPVCWVFVTEGKTDIFFDGALVYSRVSGVDRRTESITSNLTRGWHNIVFRVTALRGRSWSLSFNTHFNRCEGQGAQGLLVGLPSYLAPVRAGAPLLALMKLVEIKSNMGAVPFIPGNHTPSTDHLADFPLKSHVERLLHSTENIWVFGEKVQYEWVAERSTNGLWDIENTGGSFNEYKAFALYAAEEMEVRVHISSHVSHRLWVNGVLAGSSHQASVGESRHAVRLVRGWNRLMLKLNVTGVSLVLDAEVGKVTRGAAQSICWKRGGMRLCSLSELCPLGLVTRNTSRISGASFQVPLGYKDGWVRVATGNNNKTLHCYGSHENGAVPGLEEREINSHSSYSAVLCCEGAPPLPMWISIHPPTHADGKVGYTYDLLHPPGPVTKSEPAPVAQRDVSINSAGIGDLLNSDKVSIKYSTGILTVTGRYGNPYSNKKVTNIANATREILVDRVACLVYTTCVLTVTGVERGDYFSLLRTDTDESMLKRFLERDYAKSQQPTLSFSGLLEVGRRGVVIVPPLGTGSFYMIAYKTSATTVLAEARLTYRGVLITPKEVVGTQASAFREEGVALNAGDVVLISTGNANTPENCDSAACRQELSLNKYGVTVIQSNRSAPFTQDLYGFVGTVNCLCICLSCSTPPYTPVTVRVEPSNVVGFPINVAVTSPGPLVKESVAAIRPWVLRDGENVNFYGQFEPQRNYSIDFSPAGASSSQCSRPSCTVNSITKDLLTCEVHVKTRLACNWTVRVLREGKNVPFVDNCFTTLLARPSPPSVDYVTGACASMSARCVNGSQLTLHGKNFNAVGADYNRVVIGLIASEALALCDVISASEDSITCSLKVLREEGEQVYPIGVEIRMSKDEWEERREAGYLILGGGFLVGGWRKDPVLRSVWSKNYEAFLYVMPSTLFAIFGTATILFVKLDRKPTESDVPQASNPVVSPVEAVEATGETLKECARPRAPRLGAASAERT